eukprot:TRINITY_DN61499_c0_g1_i1.p1 TRINITY_DN61499_c0_g1~~TRINITY_DN61499_c0_g1_i1.p1  ORF type:complete len:121 (-),score=6.91 TRINITY_DN61499_c0_g1_i1:112-474(-)
MVEINDEDDKLVVLDLAQNPIVADSVSPEMAKFLALHGLALLSGIVQPRNPLFKIGNNPPGLAGRDLFQRVAGFVGELNRPGQVPPSLLRENRCGSRPNECAPTPLRRAQYRAGLRASGR